MSPPTFWLLSLVSPHFILPSLAPPPVPTNVPLKRKEWERGIREFTYFFCALSTATTSLLPLVTLSLSFEGFQDEMGRGYQSNNLPISYVHSQLLPFIPPPRDTLPLFWKVPFSPLLRGSNKLPLPQKCKHITWLACTIARQCTRSAVNKWMLISHASTAYLEEKKRKMILRQRKIQSHKRER
jgi:hypothetical protein